MLETVLVFGLVGLIARAIILLLANSDKVKEYALISIKNTSDNRAKISVCSQVIFILIAMQNYHDEYGYYDSFESIIKFIGFSSPLIILYGLKWFSNSPNWHWWHLFLGLILNALLAGIIISDTLGHDFGSWLITTSLFFLLFMGIEKVNELNIEKLFGVFKSKKLWSIIAVIILGIVFLEAYKDHQNKKESDRYTQYINRCMNTEVTSFSTPEYLTQVIQGSGAYYECNKQYISEKDRN